VRRELAGLSERCTKNKQKTKKASKKSVEVWQRRKNQEKESMWKKIMVKLLT
jgi:hypothetical protein